jgi:hypothetical protein
MMPFQVAQLDCPPVLAEVTPEPVLEGRVLHLVDLENLAGCADFSIHEAARLYRAYARSAPHGRVDQVVLATSHYAALQAWFGWPASTRRLVRSGRHGADLALLEVLERESVESRFEHVVLGSGDGVFAFKAAGLQAAGLGVTVVARQGALSRQLRLAARDVRYIDRRGGMRLHIVSGAG